MIYSPQVHKQSEYNFQCKGIEIRGEKIQEDRTIARLKEILLL